MVPVGGLDPQRVKGLIVGTAESESASGLRCATAVALVAMLTARSTVIEPGSDWHSALPSGVLFF